MVIAKVWSVLVPFVRVLVIEEVVKSYNPTAIHSTYMYYCWSYVVCTDIMKAACKNIFFLCNKPLCSVPEGFRIKLLLTDMNVDNYVLVWKVICW